MRFIILIILLYYYNMERFQDHELRDKQYVSHTADKISIAIVYYKRRDLTH